MAGKRIPAPVKKICDLLKEDRAEYQRAAAIILGELGVRDSYVVRALGEVLNNGDDRALKGHVLDAFEKIKSKESLNYLLPFLLHNGFDGDAFSERAVAIASSLGADAARTMKGRLRKADAQERCILNSIFIRMRNLEGLKVVLESLEDQDPEVVSTICRLMKDEAGHYNSQERKRFSRRIEAFLKEKKKVKSRTTTVAGIRILGYIACPESKDTLLSFTTLKNHPSVRSQALKSLKNVPLEATSTGMEVIKRLLSYLEESDFTNIVSPTMDILLKVPFQARMADWVIRLLDNPHEAVRRFAIRKMRELNSPKVVRVLIDLLGDGDPGIRDLAAESLCWLDAARSVLLERIMEEEDPDRCWLYARILRPHSAKFRSRQITRLSEYLNRLMDSGSPLQEPLLFLIRTVAPDYLQESLLDRSRRLKGRKKYPEAVQTLRIIERNGSLGDDARYELAVCLLKSVEGGKAVRGPESRAALGLFQQLLKEGEFPLLERIQKEKALTREDLYFLADHFIDKLKVERDFGSDLLHILVRRHPRTKVGQASKKLLHRIEAG